MYELADPHLFLSALPSYFNMAGVNIDLEREAKERQTGQKRIIIQFRSNNSTLVLPTAS